MNFRRYCRLLCQSLLLSSYFLSGPLAPPRDITVNATSHSTIHVEWLPNPSPLVQAYVIQCTPLDSSSPTKTMQVNATNTTVEIDGLSSSTNYSVKLHTVTWCKNGSWSKAVIVSTEEGGKDTYLLVGQKVVDLRSRGIVRGIGEGENNKRRKAIFFNFKQHVSQVL